VKRVLRVMIILVQRSSLCRVSVLFGHESRKREVAANSETGITEYQRITLRYTRVYNPLLF